MSLSPHPLCVHILPSRKQNRENRIKSACNSNSHSNIAPSNDKRPLFVQIPATSSASLVSTSLPVKCIRPSNFFFYRRIFLNSFPEELFFWGQLLFRFKRSTIFYSDSPFFSGKELFFGDNYSFDLRGSLNLYIDSPSFSEEELFFLDNTPFHSWEAILFHIESLFFLRMELFFYDDIPLLSKKES